MKASFLAAAVAAALVAATPAHAQSGSSGSSSPAGDNTMTNGSKPASVQKAENTVSNSGAGQMTKRAARKTRRVVKRGADGVTNTGNAIARKLPPAPAKQQ